MYDDYDFVYKVLWNDGCCYSVVKYSQKQQEQFIVVVEQDFIQQGFCQVFYGIGCYEGGFFFYGGGGDDLQVEK